MQSSNLTEESLLPALRQDLQIKHGIREVDGSETWVIYDALRHRYFQIDHKSVQMLNHWHLDNAGALIDALVHHAITLEDVEEMIWFFYLHSLTQDPPEGEVKHYVAQANQRTRSWLSRAVHNYLFIRVPLCRPHSVLKRTEPLTRFLFGRVWWTIIAVMGLSGLFFVSRQWDQFIHTFMHFFNLEGMFYYSIALVFVKILHELGHAYSATRFGCRISTMGVALLVLFPVLYTDTTDTWKLTSRRERLVVNGAGVAVELMIAIIATFLWVFLPDGPMRSVAFFIATSSWIMSVAVNMNPLMRFDGYHFLSDALGVQNLQSRSFELGRWMLREKLFGLNEVAPEGLHQRLRSTLILLAWSTWVYRFFLFLGIALLVHYLFFKPLGTILALTEVFYFIALPILNELKQWWQRRNTLVKCPLAWRTTTVMILFTLLVLVPWQSKIRIPAVIEAADHHPVFATHVGEIQQIRVSQGQTVEQGELLLDVKSPQLDNEINRANRQRALVLARLDRAVADADELEQKIVLQQELSQLDDKLIGLQEERELLRIRAPIAGIVTDLDPTLHNGRWINPQMRLASIVSSTGARVRGFIAAEDMGRIVQGAQSVFMPDMKEREKMAGVIDHIDVSNTDAITLPALASAYGGPIAVTRIGNELKPMKAWYRVNVSLDESPLVPDQTAPGQLLAKGKSERLIEKVWRRAVHVIIREVLI